jgi:ubiquinone/menaquinone biosynthesis C-methylase UbiE
MDNSASAVFDRDYFIGGERSHYPDYREIEGAIEEAFMPTVRKYAKYAGAGKVNRSYLDIGCAMGFMVQRVAALDWDAHGIDVSEWAIEQGRERGHTNIQVASATDLPFADESFDFVTAIDVIEHLPADLSPTMVAETHRVLRPGGLAFYATPNPLTNALWNKFTPDYFDEDETHINYQSVDSLKEHFEAYSECYVYGHTPWSGQFRAAEQSGAFDGRGFNTPIIGKLMRRLGRKVAWSLLGNDVQFSSYLHAVAIK